MSGTFARPTLAETLDAILDHDIRHVQFNWGSAHPAGPLPEVIDAICPVIRRRPASGTSSSPRWPETSTWPIRTPRNGNRASTACA